MNCYKKENDQISKTNNTEKAFWINGATNDPETTYAANLAKGKHRWCIDNGYTSHMCNNQRLFTNHEDVNGGLKLADGMSTPVIARDAVKVSTDVDEQEKTIRLENTLLIPDLRTNLFRYRRLLIKITKCFSQRTALWHKILSEILR